MDWLVMIIRLCALRDALRRMDDYDAAHPVFRALDRVSPRMAQADQEYAEAVIAQYREALAVREGATE